jgi:hypothetical protein
MVVDLFQFDACSGLGVALVALVLGHWAAHDDERVRRAGAASGGVIFLVCLFTTLAAGLARKRHPFDFFVKCFELGAAAVGMSWIVAAVVAWLIHLLFIAPRQARREAEDRLQELEQRREQGKRYALEQHELQKRQQALHEAQLQGERLRNAPPPPPLPRKEVFAAAKRKRDEVLEALKEAGLSEEEFAAAREKVHQQYLIDIDKAM